MLKVNLDERLKVISEYVSQGSVVADIGTDHGYLPIYLIQNKISSFVYACDINEFPLESAKKNIIEYGVSNQAETILTNGLENLEIEKLDEIIIAGMGGELIFQIIKNYKFSNNQRLILQPMTSADILRKQLILNGFNIIEEKSIIDYKHFYCVMYVEYNGKINSQVSDEFCQLGMLPFNDDLPSKMYILKQINKILKISYSMKGSKNDNKADECFNLAQSMEVIYNYGYIKANIFMYK